MANLFELMEGADSRKWYVAKSNPPKILSGPYKSRKAAREKVFEIARKADDPKPWPDMEAPADWPGFAIMRTGLEVYYVGRASALYDQGPEWGEVIERYIRAWRPFRRPPLDRMEALRGLSEAPRSASTYDVYEFIPPKHSRHQLCYQLSKLEREGLVDKEILFGATSIGHAFWTITDAGWKALDEYLYP